MPPEARLVRFLLIEDDPDHAHLIRRSLKRSRVANNLVHFPDGQAGLNYLRGEGEHSERMLPDVVLLDLRLPGLSGHEVLKAIRADENLAHIQVVILTTSADERDRETAAKLNANSYLIKPLEFSQFQKMVDDLSFYWGVWNLTPSLDEDNS